MGAFFCGKCNLDMPFDHTDYYDFDIYKCPKCGQEFSMPADDYGAPDDYEYDEEDFGYDDDQDYDYSTCSCGFCGCSMPVSTSGDVCNDCRAGAHQG